MRDALIALAPPTPSNDTAPSPFHREDINLISLKPPIVATVAIVYKNNKSMDTLAKQILMAIGSNENT